VRVWPSGVPSRVQMRAIPVVVANILESRRFRWRFVNYDVIQEITTATPYQRSATPFCQDFRTKCGQDSRSGIEPLSGLPVHTWLTQQ